MPLVIHLVTTAMFVLLGILFMRGKGAFLIAGYNTSSPAEKARTDEKKLCRFMGKFMFVLAGCWLVVASSEIFHTIILFWVGFALFFVAIIIGVVYANTKDRFKK